MSFYRIQHRRGPAAEWSASNPVLAGGEFGVETDTGKFKVGNGATAWSGLPYYQDANGIIATITDNAPATLNTLNEIAEALNDNPDILDTLVTKNNATFTGTADFSNATVTGINLLPSQTNQSGKYLTTNGSTTSWATIDLSSKQDVVSGVTSTQISYLGGAVPVTSSIQNQLNQKAALSHAHSISDVTGLQTELDSKLESADLSNYATQSYVNSAISSIPAPNLTGYATESYVNTAVSNLVDSAPSTLDTLNELAAALGDDPNYATTITTALSNKQNKVASVTDTEIGYLGGAFPVTSGIQTQLDSKANSSHIHGMGDLVDFSLPSPVANQILRYNGTKWVASGLTRLSSSGNGVFSTGAVEVSNSSMSTTMPTLGMYDSGNNHLSFAANSTQILYGHATNGVFTTQSLNVGTAVNQSAAIVRVGRNRSGNGDAQVDLISDTINTDFGARIIRAGGANGGLTVTNRGTGGISINTSDSASITIGTANTARLTIAANGQVTGNFGNVINNISSNTTLAASHRGSIVRSTSGAITLSIDTSSGWSIGDRCDFLQAGTGQITFSPSGVTLVSADNKRKTNKQFSGATLICVDTNTFHLIGDIAA